MLRRRCGLARVELYPPAHERPSRCSGLLLACGLGLPLRGSPRSMNTEFQCLGRKMKMVVAVDKSAKMGFRYTDAHGQESLPCVNPSVRSQNQG